MHGANEQTQSVKGVDMLGFQLLFSSVGLELFFVVLLDLFLCVLFLVFC